MSYEVMMLLLFLPYTYFSYLLFIILVEAARDAATVDGGEAPRYHIRKRDSIA
jgi:hypothetical protein